MKSKFALRAFVLSKEIVFKVTLNHLASVLEVGPVNSVSCTILARTVHVSMVASATRWGPDDSDVSVPTVTTVTSASQVLVNRTRAAPTASA